jgi:hypothetical protein
MEAAPRRPQKAARAGCAPGASCPRSRFGADAKARRVLLTFGRLGAERMAAYWIVRAAGHVGLAAGVPVEIVRILRDRLRTYRAGRVVTALPIVGRPRRARVCGSWPEQPTGLFSVREWLVDTGRRGVVALPARPASTASSASAAGSAHCVAPSSRAFAACSAGDGGHAGFARARVPAVAGFYAARDELGGHDARDRKPYPTDSIAHGRLLRETPAPVTVRS